MRRLLFISLLMLTTAASADSGYEPLNLGSLKALNGGEVGHSVLVDSYVVGMIDAFMFEMATRGGVTGDQRSAVCLEGTLLSSVASGFLNHLVLLEEQGEIDESDYVYPVLASFLINTYTCSESAE